jgi:outer membrane lipoprotein-sorting protein
MNRGGFFLPFILIPVFFLLFQVDSNAYKFDFVTVGDIVQNVRKKFGSVNTYQAGFTIVSEKLGKKKQQSGVIKYKSTDKMLIEFSQPSGQRIVSNGKTMWIYIPSMNVVAEQDLKSDGGVFSGNAKSSLNRLFTKYHYRFASKNQPVKQSDGSNLYVLHLKQKETRAGLRDITLYIDDNYLIIRAAGETSSGKKIDITFSNIKTDIEMPNAMFKFDVPARARLIKNPMISEE